MEELHAESWCITDVLYCARVAYKDVVASANARCRLPRLHVLVVEDEIGLQVSAA
jgi:hypothetical protein